MEDYVPFDGLVHAMHVQAARSILQDGAIRGHPVLDNSVANVKDGKDPFRRVLATAHCVWLAPNCSAGDFFGSVVFHLGLWGSEVSILRQKLCVHMRAGSTIQY